MIYSLILMLLLAACGGGTESSGPPTITFTPLPTDTPTPRATALPEVNTPVPLGVEETPLKVAFLNTGSGTTINRAVRDLTNLLTDEASDYRLGLVNGLTVEVVLIDSQQEALDLLCNSRDTAVWIDAFTFAAAVRDCGAIPALQVEKGTGQNASTGSTFELVVNTRQITNIEQLIRSERNTKFCTLDRNDLTGFIHPALAFLALETEISTNLSRPRVTQRELLSLLDGSVEIVTEGFETDVEMVQALQGGGNTRLCESLALPAGRFDEIVKELADEDITLREVGIFDIDDAVANLSDLSAAYNDVEAHRWSEIPYNILAFPRAELFLPEMRQEITQGFLDLEEDGGTSKRTINTLVEHDDLIAVTSESESIADFLNWLGRAGWDMASPTVRP